ILPRTSSIDGLQSTRKSKNTTPQPSKQAARPHPGLFEHLAVALVESDPSVPGPNLLFKTAPSESKTLR
ncbi:MAG: hypothetical protein WA660_14080, partial [Candidatus Acidiferrales bacterium]